MKALTTWQPYASLIMCGAKPYEFRSWRPPASVIGERIVIHASKRDYAQPEKVIMGAIERDGRAAQMICVHADIAAPIIAIARQGGLWFGRALGTAVVGEPKPISEVAAEFGVKSTIYGPKIIWAWPLLDIDHWEQTIPMTGRQGLWNWPEPADLCL